MDRVIWNGCGSAEGRMEWNGYGNGSICGSIYGFHGMDLNPEWAKSLEWQGELLDISEHRRAEVIRLLLSMPKSISTVQSSSFPQSFVSFSHSNGAEQNIL